MLPTAVGHELARVACFAAIHSVEEIDYESGWNEDPFGSVHAEAHPEESG